MELEFKLIQLAWDLPDPAFRDRLLQMARELRLKLLRREHF